MIASKIFSMELQLLRYKKKNPKKTIIYTHTYPLHVPNIFAKVSLCRGSHKSLLIMNGK